MLGVTSCNQAQRQEELLNRQVQIEAAAADPSFTYVSPNMLNRTSADQFGLYKAAGTVLDLHVECYDRVFIHASSTDAKNLGDFDGEFEVRMRGRFNKRIDVTNGVFITITAEQDFGIWNAALDLLVEYLNESGLHVDILTPLGSVSVFDVSYTNQTGESVLDGYTVDASTGEQFIRELSSSHRSLADTTNHVYIDMASETYNKSEFSESYDETETPKSACNKIISMIQNKQIAMMIDE